MKKRKTDVDDFLGYEEDKPLVGSDASCWINVFEEHCVALRELKASVDVLPYWLKKPDSELKRLALQILSTPASSAPVERVFSKAGLVITPLRGKTKGDLLEAILKHKYNK